MLEIRWILKTSFLTMSDHVALEFFGTFFPHISRNVAKKREGKRPSCCVWRAGSHILSKKNPLEKLVCEVQISLIFVFQTIYKLPSSCRFLLSLVSVIYNSKCCS